MSRWSEGSCLWRCCCCGCLFPFILIKILFLLLICIPCWALYSLVGVYFFIKGTPQFLYTIITQKRFGLKVNILLAIIFLIPASFFLPGFIFLTLLAAIFFSIFYPFEVTFDHSKNPFCGLGEAPGKIWDAMKDMRNNMNEILQDLARARENPLPAGEVPWDVTFAELFSCLIAFIIALIFMYPVWLIILALKFLPFSLRVYVEFWKGFLGKDHGCCAWFGLSILFFFGNLLLPVPLVLVLVAAMIHGLVCCFYSIFVCYDYNLWIAIKYLGAVLQRYDAQSYSIIMHSWGSQGGDRPQLSCFELCGSCSTDPDVLPYAESMVDLI